MYYSTIIPFLLAAAQSALAAETILVVVGGPGGAITYTPSSVNASIGDVIRFQFQQKNHTVTQSTLGAPCLSVLGGFDSGFQPVPDAQTDSFPEVEISIQNLKPVWAFCRQGNHCQQGMVFAVNPGNDFEMFKNNAATDPFGNNPTTTTNASAPTDTATTPAVPPAETTTGTTTSPGAGTTGSPVDHRVIVGGTNIIAFSPANITAAVGDTITFEFRQKNHTVTASSFDTPCRALSSTSTTGQLGFDSGFMPVDPSVTSNFPTYTVSVNDTNPIWAYCRQATHCGQGMVFSANAVESGPKNFAAFQTLAKQQNGTTTTTSTPASGAQAAYTAPTSYLHAMAVALGAVVFFA